MKFIQYAGISSKTLAIRLKELQKGGIFEREGGNDELLHRVEYKLTNKGQELVGIIKLMIFMTCFDTYHYSIFQYF